MTDSKFVRGTVQVSIVDGAAKINFGNDADDLYHVEHIARVGFEALRDHRAESAPADASASGTSTLTIAINTEGADKLDALASKMSDIDVLRDKIAPLLAEGVSARAGREEALAAIRENIANLGAPISERQVFPSIVWSPDNPEWRAEQVWKAALLKEPDGCVLAHRVANAEREFDALLARQRAKFAAPAEG